MTSLARPILVLVAFAACSTTDDPIDTIDAGTDAPAATSGVTAVDLGAVTDGSRVTLTIPEYALGFHVVVEIDGATGTENVGIATITSPTGDKVVDEFVPVGHVAATAASRYGIVATSVPLTSAASAIPLQAGAWSIEVSIPGGQPAHARAFVRTTIDGEFHGGTLDVRVYIPEGLMIADPMAVHAITAATAATDPCVMARLDSFFATLDELFELGRGNVEFIALPADLIALADNDARLRALDLTTGMTPSAHLILVNELTLFGNPVWGHSPGIPGTATTAGHRLAAVVVDISLGFTAAADGMTMVHELGHFMGLFHTTEQNREYHDPLADTPECATGATTCPDGNNIMFATFFGASGGIGLTTSAQQRRVVWGSPLYSATAP